MKIKIAPTARQQIAELVQWWNTHRRAARVRVEDAVTTALDAMLSNPEIGSRYSKEPRYRLWRLKGTPYVLFYRVDETADTIWVAVVWSANRGAGPPLP